MTVRAPKTEAQYYCSFCCKSQHQVVVLIAGPAVFICDECVRACIPIVEEAVKTAPRAMVDGDLYGDPR